MSHHEGHFCTFPHGCVHCIDGERPQRERRYHRRTTGNWSCCGEADQDACLCVKRPPKRRLEVPAVPPYAKRVWSDKSSPTSRCSVEARLCLATALFWPLRPLSLLACSRQA